MDRHKARPYELFQSTKSLNLGGLATCPKATYHHQKAQRSVAYFNNTSKRRSLLSIERNEIHHQFIYPYRPSI
jgi:hypothetical protein